VDPGGSSSAPLAADGTLAQEGEYSPKDGIDVTNDEDVNVDDNEDGNVDEDEDADNGIDGDTPADSRVRQMPIEITIIQPSSPL
jgi:hypothetical protein